MPVSILILGSNSALPAYGRHPSAQVFQYYGDNFLLDCGEGTQIRLSTYKVKRSKIKAIFISHLHGDHVFGLPGLLTSLSLSGHQAAIDIFGPIGIKAFVENTLHYSHSVLGFPLEIHETDPGSLMPIFSNKYFEVSAFPLKHRVPTCGYLFKEFPKKRGMLKEKIEEYNIPVEKILDIKSGANFIREDGKEIANYELTTEPVPPLTYAYCTDTIFDLELIKHIEGVDLLYHEATFCNDKRELAKDRFHSTAEEAATIAKTANVNKLIIGHFSSRYKQLECFLSEAQNIFPNTELALEGKIVELKN